MALGDQHCGEVAADGADRVEIWNRRSASKVGADNQRLGREGNALCGQSMRRITGGGKRDRSSRSTVGITVEGDPGYRN